MQINWIDLAADCLLRVSLCAFVTSLLSRSLHLTYVAFAAGAMVAVLAVALAVGIKIFPHLRPVIAFNFCQILIGVALGVFA